MRELEIAALVPDRGVKEAYDILRDFERYPAYRREVRSGVVEPNGGESFSTWETTFRGGLLRWKEKDWFDPESNTIGFEQTEGDIEHFSGWWKIAGNVGDGGDGGDGGGSNVRFW